MLLNTDFNQKLDHGNPIRKTFLPHVSCLYNYDIWFNDDLLPKQSNQKIWLKWAAHLSIGPTAKRETILKVKHPKEVLVPGPSQNPHSNRFNWFSLMATSASQGNFLVNL